MGRLLTFLLGFAVLAFLAYRYLEGGMPGLTGGDAEPPKQRLENVQKKADEIEREMQERANRVVPAQ